MPRTARPLGPPHNLPSDDEVAARLLGLAQRFPQTAQAEIALLKIRLVVRQTRGSWTAELHEPTKAEKTAARALRKALAIFFKSYRGLIFAPLLDARKHIDQVLNYVAPESAMVKHGGKHYRLRFGVRMSEEQRKLRFESELWKVLADHNLVASFPSVHDAVKDLCGFPFARADSAQRRIRGREAAQSRLPKLPAIGHLGEMLEALQAAPKSKRTRQKRRIVPRARNKIPH